MSGILALQSMQQQLLHLLSQQAAIISQLKTVWDATEALRSDRSAPQEPTDLSALEAADLHMLQRLDVLGSRLGQLEASSAQAQQLLESRLGQAEASSAQAQLAHQAQPRLDLLESRLGQAEASSAQAQQLLESRLGQVEARQEVDSRAISGFGAQLEGLRTEHL
jgi:BMFP domain-containing protein YqiC